MPKLKVSARTFYILADVCDSLCADAQQQRGHAWLVGVLSGFSTQLREESNRRAAREAEHVSACLNRNECPRCASRLLKTIDSRQAGPTELQRPGTWWNIRCIAPGCGFMIDKREPDAPTTMPPPAGSN